MAFTKKALGRISAILLGIGFLILIIVGSASLYLALRTRDYSDSVAALQAARVIAGSTLSALQDAETGQRGYLLTHNPDYLAPFKKAEKELPGEEASLTQIMLNLPSAGKLTEELLAAIQQKLAELNDTIRLEDNGEHARALQLVGTDAGKRVMDTARKDVDQILSLLDKKRQTERDLLFSRNDMLLVVCWTGLLLILLVSFIAGGVIIRYMKESEQAQKEIEESNILLEQRVRERTTDLQEANDEVQRFAYIVSHDLRAPLVNIMGFTSELEASVSGMVSFLKAVSEKMPELVTDDIKLIVDEDLPEAVAFIRTSTQRMDRLINAILKLSREGRRNLTPEKIAAENLFQSIASSLQHQLDETSTEVVVSKPIPDIVSDRLAVEQIFGNLIDNAVKYLQPGRPGRIVIRGKNEKGRVRYEIEDNGRGIEQKDRERVFELFRRAGAQDRPGEGIGLAHVRALVRRLGGTIDFTSQPGQGATFIVTLPRTLSA